MTSTNSLTFWLVNELGRQKGCIGRHHGDRAWRHKRSIAAMKTKQIDGVVADIATLLRLEEAGDGKILLRFGNLVKDFHIHVIFATNTLIGARPDAIRDYLKGWFEAIAFMADKARTVEIAMEVGNVNQRIAEHAYDELMPMFSDDGKFNPKALAVLSRSYVELKILLKEPDMSKFYTRDCCRSNSLRCRFAIA